MDEKLFNLEWIDFKAASMQTDLVPKIAVYSTEKMEELIRLVEEDRQRSTEHRRYKTRPEGSMAGLGMRWHPLMVPRTELTVNASPVGVEEGMENIMLVIEETVMPMMMDAVVRVATEMTEANRSSVIEDMFSKMEDQKKKMQFCFGSKLFPDAVRMAPKFPAITYGEGRALRVGYSEDVCGSSSRATGAAQSSVVDLDPVAGQRDAATNVHAAGSVTGLAPCVGAANSVDAVTAGFGVTSPGTMAAGVHDSMQTLVPYGDSDEEVDLPDDDVAFCLRSMFAEAGGSADGGAEAGTSSGAPVAAVNRISTDEAYARELDSKLGKKEIDAYDDVEDPLAVAAHVNKRSRSASGSIGGAPMLVVDDMRTMRPIRVVAAPVGDSGHGDVSRKRSSQNEGGAVRKKVKFLSEITTQIYPRESEHATEDEAARGVQANVDAPVGVTTTAINNARSVASGSDQPQFPPGYHPRRAISAADKGKDPMVQADPVIEVVQRALSGAGLMIRDGGQPTDGRSAETRETYPGKLGMHPDEPIGMEVMGFDDKMKRCSSIDLSRKWYCHTHPYTLQLTGAQIMACFDHDGDPKVDHMETMWRLVRKEEEKLFAGLPERFRVIPDFRLGNELMEAERSSDLDFDYIATMITEEHTGVRIEAAKKHIMLLLKYMDSWAVCAIDIEKKMCLVMDPVETEEPRHEMEAKHKRNAIRVLSNLRRCIHECIPGVQISSVGWGLDFNTGMHTCCKREESWIYGMHYLRDYTGEKVQDLSDSQIDYLGKSLVYQLVTMQENRAVLPYCMRGSDEMEM